MSKVKISYSEKKEMEPEFKFEQCKAYTCEGGMDGEKILVLTTSAFKDSNVLYFKKNKISWGYLETLKKWYHNFQEAEGVEIDIDLDD